MTIKSRLDKINEVARAVTTKQIFGNGKKQPSKVYRINSVRTNNDYQVIVNWSKCSESNFNVSVQFYTFEYKEQINQNGNHRVDFNNSTVCYQALGVLKFAAKQANKVLSLCENKVDAKRLLNFGGKLIKITNLGNAIVWGVVR